MPKPADISNHRFGRLTAICALHTDANNKVVWLCQCDCGNSCNRRVGDLRTRKNCSCGCGKSFKHGYARTKVHPLYDAWHNIVQRCTNPNRPGFKNYGARGIQVCERWKDFTNFLADILAEIGERPPGLSIDRINNDGNYEPGNVRWSTQSEQTKNRRPVTPHMGWKHSPKTRELMSKSAKQRWAKQPR
jgi:hypothetical protein